MKSAEVEWENWLLRQSGARSITGTTLIQSLWGGYGQLLRVNLTGGPFESVILKRMVPPDRARDIGDQRKRRSYQVEQAWYLGRSKECDDGCRVAKCLGTQQLKNSSLLLLEDLNCAGFFPMRPPNRDQIGSMLCWLACFHARFFQERPAELWKQGGYWHLDTRPSEYANMPSGILKEKAAAIDRKLKNARYQTILHGDPKPANFCWNARGDAAAVDFQYVGAGCGIRDVAYVLDCWLEESGKPSQADEWLELYFTTLKTSLKRHHNADCEEIESEWRQLFPVAWADFSRFLQGWGNSGQLGRYSQQQLNQALTILEA